MRGNDPAGDITVPAAAGSHATMQSAPAAAGGEGAAAGRAADLAWPAVAGELDAATHELLLAAVVIAVGDEQELRAGMQRVADAGVPAEWVEELVLQSYMFSGFPRGLNAAREWRRASGVAAPQDDEGADFGNVEAWRERGEAVCEVVYGAFYKRLRGNVRRLHPALDEWMIVEGYGKLLGRQGLDLRRRELCVVAVCAAGRQERQLHSHFHGAFNAGASVRDIETALNVAAPHLPDSLVERYARLLQRVRESRSAKSDLAGS